MNDPSIIPVGGEPAPMLESTRRPGARSPTRSKPPGRRDRRRLGASRFAVLNGFVDCSMAGLSRAELATWLVLYRDTRNGTARTGADDIARRTGTTRRHVLKAIGRLIRRGLLIRVYRGGLNRGPSIYRVQSHEPAPRAGEARPARRAGTGDP